MNNLSRHFVNKSSSIWIVVGVSILVLGWRLGIVTIEHFGADKIADQFIAIRQFRQDVIPNHASTRLTFCEDTEKGVGIYFCDTDGGSPRLLCEKKENPLQWRRFSMLGWSPDDRLFACALPDEKLDKEFVFIFDGAKGDQVAKLEVDQNLEQFAWLTSGSFAYATRTDVRVVINRGHSWEHKRFFEKVAVNLENFTAVSDHTVAWRDAADIWLLDINSSSPPQKIWGATTNRLVGFTYAKSGEFSINCSDENGQFYYILFSPSSKEVAPPEKIGSQYFSPDINWMDGDPRFAYWSDLISVGSWPDICIQAKPNQAPIRVPWEGCVETFTLSGDYLFFRGYENGKLPGIWEYNIKSGMIRCVVDKSIHEPVRALVAAPVIGFMTNSSGAAKIYYLWQPAQISDGRKHPLIITSQFWNWFPYGQIAVNEGYYFAVVDESCMAAFNEALAKNPNVDAKHIYLYESSARSSIASKLISEEPESWQGAILFGPTALPDVTKLQGKKIMIIAGEDDSGAVSRLSEYQNQAATLGTPVTVYILANAGHMPESDVSERKRARQFANFLSANHWP